MTVNPEALQAIFERIEAGKRLRQNELQTLGEAARSQHVAIATGDRAVAIGGSADGAVIVTGNRNLIITGADAEVLRDLMGTRPHSETLLLKASKDEVESRLKNSLRNAVLINLGIEDQPHQIQHPWGSDIKIGNSPVEPIPEDWNIYRVFDEAQGKLLILGNPGAGKTTTILELANVLLVQAETDANFPIPVLFNLSNWKGNQQSIYSWLISELKARPFCNVPEKTSQRFLQEKRLLPLLDGLDELRTEHQELCVEAINQFIHQEHSPLYLVVSSRQEEYSNYITRLKLHGAICIRDLNNEQIKDYLLKIERVDLWEILYKEQTLLELVHTPFWLSILVLSEQELQVRDWLALESKEERLEWLLNSYIKRMFTRYLKNNPYKNQEPAREKSEYWLIWMAQKLNKNFQSEFLIEALQPSNLLNQDLQQKYQLSMRLGIDLSFGILFGVFVALTNKQLLPSVIAGALAAWTVDQKNEIYQGIQIIERFNWSWTRARFSLKILLITSLFVTPITTAVAYYFKPQTNLFLGLLVLMSFITCAGLGGGFFGGELENSKISNQGIWKSLAISLRFSLIGGVIFGTILIFGISMNSQINNWLLTTSGSALLLGTVVGLQFGGRACIQHFFLRLLLYQKGLIPWHYARFLDYCTERLLLQRVGGRYRFIHRLLQEHFAAMPLERE